MDNINNFEKTVCNQQEIDWQNLPIDTKVLVRDEDTEEWILRYYAGYSNGLYCAYPDGCTSSNTTKGNLTVRRWSQCRLAEK